MGADAAAAAVVVVVVVDVVGDDDPACSTYVPLWNRSGTEGFPRGTHSVSLLYHCDTRRFCAAAVRFWAFPEIAIRRRLLCPQRGSRNEQK